jgi:5-methylthioadenosine/S-adenosylhomocysteine deaminase
MRVLARREPRLPPRSIIRMATINGARALGMQGRVGELAPGTFADLIALPLTATTGDVWEKVLDYSGSVAASMIGGKWAIPLRT